MDLPSDCVLHMDVPWNTLVQCCPVELPAVVVMSDPYCPIQQLTSGH